MPDDHDFSEELAVALKEQTFGIDGYEIINEHAVIRLLDQNRAIVVKVSEGGWEVRGAPKRCSRYLISA